ncbi:MAG: hypothetical protein SF172_17945 [Burkholderiales bacterium]|nr:hypothetical protein [Burkholderiales bacterium]
MSILDPLVRKRKGKPEPKKRQTKVQARVRATQRRIVISKLKAALKYLEARRVKKTPEYIRCLAQIGTSIAALEIEHGQRKRTSSNAGSRKTEGWGDMAEDEYKKVLADSKVKPHNRLSLAYAAYKKLDHDPVSKVQFDKHLKSVGLRKSRARPNSKVAM